MNLEGLKQLNRRDFLKLFSILPFILYPYNSENPDILNEGKIKELLSEFFRKEYIENYIENMESKITKREIWDKRWPEIKAQYEKDIGDILYLNGKERIVSVLSYIEIAKTEGKDKSKLEDFLKNIIIHHSGIDIKNNELEKIRDSHIDQNKYNDIGYHFLIDKEGKIFEGRPIDKIGAHAGATRESKEYFKENIGELKDLKKKDKDYKEKLLHLIQTNKMDPDFGSIGICLFGSFNENKSPNEKQLQSLENLLNYLVFKYNINISQDNIMGHRDVEHKIIQEANYEKSSHDKSKCPGFDFGNMLNDLGKGIEEYIKDKMEEYFKDLPKDSF